VTGDLVLILPKRATCLLTGEPVGAHLERYDGLVRVVDDLVGVLGVEHLGRLATRRAEASHAALGREAVRAALQRDVALVRVLHVVVRVLGVQHLGRLAPVRAEAGHAALRREPVRAALQAHDAFRQSTLLLVNRLHVAGQDVHLKSVKIKYFQN